MLEEDAGQFRKQISRAWIETSWHAECAGCLTHYFSKACELGSNVCYIATNKRRCMRFLWQETGKKEAAEVTAEAETAGLSQCAMPLGVGNNALLLVLSWYPLKVLKFDYGLCGQYL